MNNKKIAAIIVVLAMLAPLTLAFAYAVTPGTATAVGVIWVDSQMGDPSGAHALSSANPGQMVYIYWDQIQPNSPTTTVHIIITPYDASGVAQTPIDLGIQAESQSGTISFTVPNVPDGACQIDLYGLSQNHNFTFQVASVTLLVLPESVLGTLAAVGAGVAAFGTVKLYQKRKKD